MMINLKNAKIVIVFILIALLIGSVWMSVQVALAAGDLEDGTLVIRSDYFDLPETVEKYVTSGKTLEFDLNVSVTGADKCKLGLYDGATFVSNEFLLSDGADGLSLNIKPLQDGWYHYVLSLATVPHKESQADSQITRFRIRTTFPAGTKIKNISIGIDVRALPEAYTDDYDVVTLADLGIAGTDYQTPVYSDTYIYKGKSKTKSVIVKFGWKANVNQDSTWKLALDTYWNAQCMVWFLHDHVHFCPGDSTFDDMHIVLPPILDGTYDIEFGRLRVVAGPNYGLDYIFFKVDGKVQASGYTDYFQTEGGYIAYNDVKTTPSYTVCFVDEGVSKQRFSGLAKPDNYVKEIDYVNIGDIVPGGVVKNTKHDNLLGYNYPFQSTSPTNSTVVKFVLKTGQFGEGISDESFMVVDIGGNCGFCRSYLSAGERKKIMFGWEIDGCTNGTKNFTFESNSWYAFEQGRVRVASGANKGKDYVYLKINGDFVSSFYANPESRPRGGQQIYIEATDNYQIVGYNELRAKYYVDGALYLDQLAQKGFNVHKPADPEKSGEYFVGWYNAKTGGALFDFVNTKLTKNVNIYARFTTETVKATFNNNDGNLLSETTVGKGCLVTAPKTPTYSGSSKYEQIFVGWKNETTGKIFNFQTDRISANTAFTAQYKEKEYFVSYYANGALVKKVAFVLSNPTVAGNEPAVPTIPNTAGVWEQHNTSGLTGNMTVNATYTVKTKAASTAISLTKFSGNKIYLNTDTVHAYLTTATAKDQTAFVREYISAVHTYQDHQNTTFKWKDSGKNSKYTVYFADNKDFKNAFIVTTGKTSLVNEVGIFIPGKTYYWFVCGNNTGKCSAVDSFTITNTPVRYITAGKVTNMRDEGGYMTQDGAKVKYGLVYRGASLDELHSQVDDVTRQVFQYLGMKSEIELRGGMNHTYTGWNENNNNVCYIEGAGYSGVLALSQNQKKQYKATFEKMADKANYPFYFHCSAGADRTGAFGYLLNGLLGVPYEDLRKDYELTSFSEVGLRAADDAGGGDSFDLMHRRILEQYGDGTGNLQVAIEKYLSEYIGVSKSTLASIKNIMLEKNAKPNEQPHTVTVDVLGKKYTYQAYDGVYFMPPAPQAIGKLFAAFYNGKTKYTGYANGDVRLTAKFTDIQFEPYDTVSLRDLGVQEDKILNQTNTTYTYEKTAKTGGRLFQFVLQPIGNMQNGDGPHIAFSNDWNENAWAHVWFGDTDARIYYKGYTNSPPDLIKMLQLEDGKKYDVQFAVRIMKNKGYEGKKIFEIGVNGEVLFQYIGCKADLSDNQVYFHGSTGACYLINKPVYQTVKCYNGNTLIGTYKVERSNTLPKIKEPAPQNGVPFAGWYTAKTGGKLWDENTDLIYKDLSLYARFANVRVITANVGGKKLSYRVEVGKTLDGLPKPQKAGNVFVGWAVNGKLFTGKVTSKMNVTALFEPYKFDDYDEISLRDLGIYNDLNFNTFGDDWIADYTYRRAAKTGGRVFKAIYVPTKEMGNGPQISFSVRWDENYFSKLYFLKNDQINVYSSGIDGGLPTLVKDYDLVGGKEYLFEVGVRVLNNKGYQGVKIFTVYINGELIFEEFNNKTNIDGNTVFFQSPPDKGFFKNVDIYKTVSFYNENRLLSSARVLRGKPVKPIGNLANKGDRLFVGWFTKYGEEWRFDVDGVYLDMVLKAKYQKRTYPVSLMMDGVLYKSIDVAVGECINIADVPTKEGYVFQKWVDADGTEYDITKPVNAPITLYASFGEKAKSENITPEKVKVELIRKQEPKASHIIEILLCLIGLLVVGLETGFLIYQKRSKR